MTYFQALRTLRCQVAVDVGTAFCRVAAEKIGVVTIPTALSAKPPLQGGVVVDAGGATDLLAPLLSRTKGLGLLGPLVLAGAPTDAHAREREALTGVLRKSGAARVRIVPEPLAAAVGSGIDISSPYAQMIVDIGEGVTDCIVLREGKIIASRAVRIGCGNLREELMRRFVSEGKKAPSREEADRVVATAGVGRVGVQKETAEGADAFPGPLSASVHEVIEPAVAGILAAPAALLREIPDDVGCEIIESGILLTGGGALIPGLSERLAAATSVRVATPESPLDVVVRGLAWMLSPDT